MAKKRPVRGGLSLRGVIVMPEMPGDAPKLYAANPEAAERALVGTTGLELANPPSKTDKHQRPA